MANTDKAPGAIDHFKDSWYSIADASESLYQGSKSLTISAWRKTTGLFTHKNEPAPTPVEVAAAVAAKQDVATSVEPTPSSGSRGRSVTTAVLVTAVVAEAVYIAYLRGAFKSLSQRLRKGKCV